MCGLFQFTRPQGARRSRASSAVPARKFQFTRPQGARPDADCLERFSLEVSIHAPARGATLPPSPGDRCRGVSIHAPARGATLKTAAPSAAFVFQFTRPQGARHARHPARPRRAEVSIHAPARGATAARSEEDALPGVSIHAPARGATRRSAGASLRRGFQFTRPQGARLRPSERVLQCSCFNSRARKGRDRRRHRQPGTCARFNSRARKGRDPRPKGRPRAECGFNSRARKGRDWQRGGDARGAGVSIHAPARGATPRLVSQTWSTISFQFTRPQGARRYALSAMAEEGWFQFTRPQGARHEAEGAEAVHASFNSRARKGRDRAGAHHRLDLRRVSIHAPARGATVALLGLFGFSKVSIHAPARGATSI